jgi:predicted GNAT superfamily acetyltransferase
MMGVLPQYRNLGIGRSLKLAQRQEALDRGISMVEWTFDPLEIRNANFNIESLGAICRRYYVNSYGVTSSPLHGKLPTDRLVAEWHLSSSRVRSKISRSPFSSDVSKETVRVELPLNIQELKTAYPPVVACIQRDLRQRFLELFKQDFCVSRVELDDSKKLASYLLEPFDKGLFLS